MSTFKPYLKLLALVIIAGIFGACEKPYESADANRPASLNTADTVSAGYAGMVTIQGKNFMVNQQNLQVSLNGKKLTIIKVYNDSLWVAIPKLIGSGRLTLTVGANTYDGPYFIYRYKATVTTLAGTGGEGDTDGPAATASFNCPWGIVADSNGDLYVADCYNRLIRKISAAGKTVSTITIPNKITGGNFFSPYNIALDLASHDMYLTDFNEHVLKRTAAGEFSVIYNGQMPTTGIALGTDGYLYVSKNNNGEILKMNTAGQDTSVFASGLVTPRNLVFDKGGSMYVTSYDSLASAVDFYKIDRAGTKTKITSDKGFGGWEMVPDVAGNIYMADYFHNRIRMIEKNGKPVTIAGSGTAADVDGVGQNASFDGPQGITIGPDGNLYVTTYNYDRRTGNKVRKVVIE